MVIRSTQTKVALLATAGLLTVATGCNARKWAGDNAQPIVATEEQKLSLEDETATAVSSSLEESILEAYKAETSLSFSDAKVIGGLTSRFVGARTAKLIKDGGHGCDLGLDPSNLTRCVAAKVLAGATESGENLRASAISMARTDADKKTVDRLSKEGYQNVVFRLSDKSFVERALKKLESDVAKIKDQVAILAYGLANTEAPFLAESFFKNRTFVMTNSFQQASSALNNMAMKVFNMSTLTVRFEVDNNRLIVKRLKDGQYQSGNDNVEEIVNTFPILYKKEYRGESYFRVDFSKPENKRFLLRSFEAGNIPELDITADVVIPNVAHARKDTLAAKSLGSGLVFDNADGNLVLNQLVLVNSTQDISGDETNAALNKDGLRPTIQISQGFFALDEKSSFNSQALAIGTAQANLGAAGIEDRTEGADVPYFYQSPWFYNAGKGNRALNAMVRKYNQDKTLTFVLSENTPEMAVPAVKAAVGAYSRAFTNMKRVDGKPAMKIEALTMTEFRKANPDLADSGSAIIAADPRVNMIYWDSDTSLGAAWATAVANPKTGEVISSDVMMSGTMWGTVGCVAFMQRAWTVDDEDFPPLTGGDTVFPSEITRLMWSAACNKVQSALSGSNAAALPNDINVDELVKATKLHDAAALATIANSFFDTSSFPAEAKRAFTSEDMMSRPNAFLGKPKAAKGTSLKDALKLKGIASALDKKLAVARGNSVKTLTKEIQSATSAMSAESLKSTLNSAQKAVRTVNGQNQDPDDAMVAAAKQAFLSKMDASSNRNAQPFMTLSSGKNSVKAKVDCLRTVMPGAELDSIMSTAMGIPGFDFKLVKTPQQAALALIRAIVIHELGHTFGLRHNFNGSTTEGVLSASAKPAVPVFTRTDSIMDYNDYGIEIGLGSMRDYTRADGTGDLPDLGLYDILTLSNAYGLDRSSFKTSVKTPFCTDSNVLTLGNCQRYDYGKDYTEYLIYDANLRLMRFRSLTLLDALHIIFGTPIGEAILSSLNSNVTRYQQDMLPVALEWGITQYLGGTGDIIDQIIYGRMSDVSWDARLLMRQDFATNFQKKFGYRLYGINQALTLTDEDNLIAPQAVKDVNTINVASVLDFIRGVVAADTQNNQVLFDLVGRSYRTKLPRIFQSHVFTPAGTKMDFVYLNDDGDLAPAGKFAINLPFFNNENQVVFLKDMDVPGAGKQLIAHIGTETEATQSLNLAALAFLDKGQQSTNPAVNLSAAILEGNLKEFSSLQDLNRCGADDMTAKCYTLDETLQRIGAGFTSLSGDALLFSQSK